MTGAEHFIEAERLIGGVESMQQVARSTAEAENWPAHEAAKWGVDQLLARAQVHATLALAASQLRSLTAIQNTN